MKTMFQLVTAAVVVCAMQAADLGDPAPELKIAKWIKGEPVRVTSNDKNVYVVEFWATWCPPCRDSIPHLTELQKRFKDKKVVIIGITDEKENVVRPFVKKLGEKMDYRVALDDSRKTTENYMKAYGINGIPHAFIVRDKRVIWQGHPMAGLDKALEEITAGRYDLEKAKSEFRVRSLYTAFQEAAASGDDELADRLAEEIRVAGKNSSFPLDQFDPAKEKKEIRLEMLKQGYQGAIYRDNEEAAREIGARLKELEPSIDLEQIEAEVALGRLAGSYLQSVSGEGASADAKAKGQELAAKLKGQPSIANEVAWHILTSPEVKERDVPLALKIAKQACEDSDWEEAHIIDTYARALFDSGKKEEAIKFQEKAVATAEGEKSEYEQTLAKYKQGKAP